MTVGTDPIIVDDKRDSIITPSDHFGVYIKLTINDH